MASATVTERDSAGTCHSPRQTKQKKDVCFTVTKTKKIPCCFQGPEQRNLLFVLGTKHPRCVYLQLTGSMVSRGINSLQFVFVLTKAFIAKVQELTSLVRQEADKRGPLEKKKYNTNTHTDACTDIQMAPWKDKHLLKCCLSAFSVSLTHITKILHTVHSGTVCHSATHKLGPMMSVEDWTIAQNRQSIFKKNCGGDDAVRDIE